MASATLASLTTRLGALSVRGTSALIASTPAQFMRASAAELFNTGECAGLGRVRYMSKKSKRAGKDDVANQQHEEWVKFQQTISVDGFETGQVKEVTSSALSGRKDRGGKMMRRRKEKELELKERMNERDRMLTDLGGGQFPPLRYSDEETERLLAEAYANIPPRAGKRGTRNLRRQRNRWHKVRKIHKRQKFFKMREHTRRMKTRSRIVSEVLKVKETGEEIRAAEREYQEEVLRRWAEKMTMGEEEEDGGATSNGQHQMVEQQQGS